MDYCAKFAETLKELMQENNVSKVKLLSDLSVKRRTLDNWLSGKLPALHNLILLADYFNCSIDYLIGFEEENWNESPNKNRPEFGEQFRKFLKTNNSNIYNLSKRVKISSTTVIYDWLNGKKEPSIETLILIAKEFKTSVDTIIGR